MLVAHNIIFDKNILLSELYRIKDRALIRHIQDIANFCTSRGCADITKIPFNSKKYKQPKLVELYSFLFGIDIRHGLHNALYDIENTVLCFTELIKSKHVDEDFIKNWRM